MENITLQTMKNKVNQWAMNDITGAKVKLNAEKIKSRCGCLSTNFTNFLERSKDKVFTARLDVANDYVTMYILDEDDSDVKWLFHIDDLIIVG
jgi:hypothetical protein